MRKKNRLNKKEWYRLSRKIKMEQIKYKMKLGKWRKNGLSKKI